MQELRQSTATAVIVGPFLDDGDGKTPEEALTIASIDADLYKFSNTHPLTATSITLTASGGSNDCAHVDNGYYSLELTATDVGTLGRMRLTMNIAGAIPVWEEFAVIPANVWDSRYSSDKLQVHVDEMTAGIITNTVLATDAIGADELSAAALAKAADIILRRRLDSVEGSSYGDALHQWSLLAAALWNVADVSPNGTNLEGYQTDGTTVITTRAVTTDSGADPITALE